MQVAPLPSVFPPFQTPSRTVSRPVSTPVRAMLKHDGRGNFRSSSCLALPAPSLTDSLRQTCRCSARGSGRVRILPASFLFGYPLRPGPGHLFFVDDACPRPPRSMGRCSIAGDYCPIWLLCSRIRVHASRLQIRTNYKLLNFHHSPRSFPGKGRQTTVFPVQPYE